MGLNGQFNARIQRLEKIVEDMPSGREVPQPSVADYGKVIGVDENGEYSLENVPKELPATTEIDAGKVVKVNASGTGYELSDAGSGLPEYTSADKGKVLTLGEGEGSETTVIVPEQIVNLVEGSASLSNVAITYDDLVAGDTATLHINDGVQSLEREMAVVEDSGEGGSFLYYLYTDDTSYYQIVYVSGEGWIFYAEDLGDPVSGEYSVSLSASVPTVEPKWEVGPGENCIRVYDANAILSDRINVISDIDGSVVEYTSGKLVLALDDSSMANSCLLADTDVVTLPIVFILNQLPGIKKVYLPDIMADNGLGINQFVPPSGADANPAFYVKEILPNAKVLLLAEVNNDNAKPLTVVDVNSVTLGYGYTARQA